MSTQIALRDSSVAYNMNNALNRDIIQKACVIMNKAEECIFWGFVRVWIENGMNPPAKP